MADVKSFFFNKKPSPRFVRIALIVVAAILLLLWVYSRGRKKGGRIIDVDAEFIDPGFDYDKFTDDLIDKIQGVYIPFSDGAGRGKFTELLNKMLVGMNADEWRLIRNKYNAKTGGDLVEDVEGEYVWLWDFSNASIQKEWLKRAEAFLT